MEEIVWWYALVAISVLACSASQLLLKNSASRDHTSWVHSILNVRVIVAYGIFFCSIPINIMAMKHGIGLKDIPILESLGYIFVPILSYVFLHEKMSIRIILSVVLIIIGITIFYQ